VSTDEEEEKKLLEWKGQKVEFYIDNQSNNIILTRGTYTLLKGKDMFNFRQVISPGTQERIVVKGLGILRKQLHCYLVYELVLQGRERMPMIKNQRAFIAAEVYSETSSKKLTVSVVVFMVKSSQFTGDSGDVGRLHKDLLQYRIIQDEEIFRFNINDQMLEMAVNLRDTNPTCIEVLLRSIRKYIRHDPVFHRTNEFA
jgi:hypothetical protein